MHNTRGHHLAAHLAEVAVEAASNPEPWRAFLLRPDDGHTAMAHSWTPCERWADLFREGWEYRRK